MAPLRRCPAQHIVEIVDGQITRWIRCELPAGHAGGKYLGHESGGVKFSFEPPSWSGLAETSPGYFDVVDDREGDPMLNAGEIDRLIAAELRKWVSNDVTDIESIVLTTVADTLLVVDGVLTPDLTPVKPPAQTITFESATGGHDAAGMA